MGQWCENNSIERRLGKMFLSPIVLSVFANPNLNGSDKIVFAILADLIYQNQLTPSNYLIKKLTGLSISSITESIKRLQKTGLIKVGFDYKSINRRVINVPSKPIKPILNFGIGGPEIQDHLTRPSIGKPILKTDPIAEGEIGSILTLINTPPKSTIGAPAMIKEKTNARIQAGLLPRREINVARQRREIDRPKLITGFDRQPPRNKFVEHWNALPGPHRHHPNPVSQVYKTAARTVNQLSKSGFRFFDVDREWMNNCGIPFELIGRQWTTEEIQDGLKRLASLFTPDFNPNGTEFPRDLGTLIYNPRSRKSQFLRVMKSYPAPWVVVVVERKRTEPEGGFDPLDDPGDPQWLIDMREEARRKHEEEQLRWLV